MIALLIPTMMAIKPFATHAWLLDTDKTIISPPTNPGTWSLSATSGLPPMCDADHYATVDPSANYPSWATKIVSSPAKTVTP